MGFITLLNKRQIVKSGLVLWLDGRDFKNEPPTEIWLDKSGQDNNATPSGFAYTTLSGSDGNGGVITDSVNDYATTQNNIGIVGNQDRTIQFTMTNHEINAGIRGIVGWGEMTTSKAFLVYSSAATLVVDKWGGQILSDTSYNFTLNQKVNICIKIQNNTISLYINGVLSGTPNAISINTTDSQLNIFGGAYTVGYAFMTLFNMLIYNRALTESEIQQNYNSLR